MTAIFDEALHRLRRHRADRMGGDDFLTERALGEALDRLAAIDRRLDDVLLVANRPDRWLDAVRSRLPGSNVTAATSAGLLRLAPQSTDLVLSLGELEASNDPVTAAFTLRHLLRPGGLLIGAMVGGNSLPRLRAAMLAADQGRRGAAPRIHPMIDGPSLSALLTAVGLIDCVVDIDRIDVSYGALDRLVGDLRAMGCTNVLAERSTVPLTRTQLATARRLFLGDADRAEERFELLHFAAWVPLENSLPRRN